jgi:hypothetical protein
MRNSSGDGPKAGPKTSTTAGTASVGVAAAGPSAASRAAAQQPRTDGSAWTGATASGFVGSADGFLGSAHGASIAASSVSVDSSRAGDASAVILSPERGQRTVLLKRLRVERLPGQGKRLTVRLRFVLSGPARVTFSVFGPAPSCSLAGRFTIAGHAGLNKVPFRGRIRGRLLHPGIYTVVPQATARAASLRGPHVAILIDARGVHSDARVPWLQSCRSATKNDLLLSETPVLPNTPRFGGVAGATRTEPATLAEKPPIQADGSVGKPREFNAWILPSGGETWRILAILMFLLASTMLLALAALEPLYALGRFRLVRTLDAHRRQVALSGVAFLAAAGILLLA